jgi:glucan phosphoethanolaminetransferase (alkaline phosphatase superfamily)
LGSHFPYDGRYPAEFERFKSDTRGLSPNRKAMAENIDQYDNSILYTDYILDRLISMLEKKEVPTSLIYFSDHGESVDLGLQHDPADFMPEHVEVPMIIWFSPLYQKTYPENVVSAKANISKPFMLDRLTQTAVDWVHLEGPFYRPEKSLLNEEFSPRNRFTQDGKIDYDSLSRSTCAIVKDKMGAELGTCR